MSRSANTSTECCAQQDANTHCQHNSNITANTTTATSMAMCFVLCVAPYNCIQYVENNMVPYP